MKAIKNLIVAFLLVVAGYWLLTKANLLPSFKEIFKAQPVVIDETPILIKQIRSLGELITTASYDEVVADSIIVSKMGNIAQAFNILAPLPIFPSQIKQLVIIGTGKVLAGTDLKEISDSSIRIHLDTVWLKLPKAKILDAIMNPSDFKTFAEKGNWTSYEVNLVKVKARNKMINRAINNDILIKAGERTKVIMETFLVNAGYKHVVFTDLHE